ncbi:MAG: hypothetical protein K1X89_18735 [Myxococcaceae bacterium]|nr:hypothetical protein [Myxococcaceae bacterium]
MAPPQPKGQVSFVALLALLLAGCPRPFTDGALGYACQRDEDCDALTRCGPGKVCVGRDAGAGGGGGGAGGGAAPPLRLATYVTSYPFTWTARPSKYTPSAGNYATRDAAVVARHLQAVEYAHLSGLVLEWYGQGTDSDSAATSVFEDSAAKPVRFAFEYLQESSSSPPNDDQVRTDLKRMAVQAQRPAYLALDAGPLFLVSLPTAANGCAMSARYQAIAQDAGVAMTLYLEVPSGGAPPSCPRPPDAWYTTAKSQGLTATAQVATLQPGFFASSESSPRLARDPVRFRADVQAWLDAGTALQLVRSFNDWGTGNPVESAVEWASDSGFGTYLDVLHELVR